MLASWLAKNLFVSKNQYLAFLPSLMLTRPKRHHVTRKLKRYQNRAGESSSSLLLSPSSTKTQTERYRAHTHQYRLGEAVHPTALANWDLDPKSLR